MKDLQTCKDLNFEAWAAEGYDLTKVYADDQTRLAYKNYAAGWAGGWLEMAKLAAHEGRVLRTIVDLLPTLDGKPVVNRIDPEDGTAERLGIVFRHTVGANDPTS